MGPETAVEATVGAAPGLVPDVEALVADLPPSAKAVFRTLKARGPLTHRDLVGATGMPPRTVRYAVARLREAGVLGERCNLRDCRQCFFFVERTCAGGATEVRRNHLGRLMGTFE